MSKTAAVQPIPEGFHSITPHIVCRDASAAIDFYKRAFGATEIMRLPGAEGKLIHASIRIGDSIVMMTDEMPQWGAVGPAELKRSPVTVHLYVTDVDAVFAKAVAAGATATMPVTDMFWGDRYGTLRDPFGHSWAIATHIRDVTHDEVKKAGAEMMKNAGNCPEAAA